MPIPGLQAVHLFVLTSIRHAVGRFLQPLTESSALEDCVVSARPAKIDL